MWTPNSKEPQMKMLCHGGATRSVAVDATGRLVQLTSVVVVVVVVVVGVVVAAAAAVAVVVAVIVVMMWTARGLPGSR